MNRPTPTFFLRLALAIFSVAFQVHAQNKPNFSGTWKMNAAKTKFEQGGPSALTIKFDHQGSSLNEVLTIGNDGGERTANFAYTLDGKESDQQMAGQPIKATAKVDGESLVIEFKNPQGFTFSRKCTLAADGKTMTINVKQVNPNGETNDLVVLDKQ
jgi:hypothetical protein